MSSVPLNPSPDLNLHADTLIANANKNARNLRIAAVVATVILIAALIFTGGAAIASLPVIAIVVGGAFSFVTAVFDAVFIYKAVKQVKLSNELKKQSPNYAIEIEYNDFEKANSALTNVKDRFRALKEQDQPQVQSFDVAIQKVKTETVTKTIKSEFGRSTNAANNASFILEVDGRQIEIPNNDPKGDGALAAIKTALGDNYDKFSQYLRINSYADLNLKLSTVFAQPKYTVQHDDKKTVTYLIDTTNSKLKFSVDFKVNGQFQYKKRYGNADIIEDLGISLRGTIEIDVSKDPKTENNTHIKWQVV